MALVQTLFDGELNHLELAISPALGELYDGDLRFHDSPPERPFVIANFASTLDGVVSYGINGQAGGSTISGSDSADAFIMGLLRASADAIIVGARTFHDVASNGLWTPEYTYPEAKQFYADYRIKILHKPEYPLLVIVSGSGNLELGRAVFRTQGVRVVVITTSAGKEALERAGATKLSSVQVHALHSTYGAITSEEILQLLYMQLGVRRLLHEGGPTLFGQFLAAKVVDELFLTLSPQIAGRTSATSRSALVQGTEFMPDHAPWFQLVSVKQKAEHLYLRYRARDAFLRSIVRQTDAKVSTTPSSNSFA
jgi:riboflavin biosynthesis pyrimidine reductase